MRAFILAVVPLPHWRGVVFTLNAFQMTAAQNMTTGSAHLDRQEAVNSIGRQG